ncbi:MAG TPA: 2-oxo acid dehydrogenase subunit E2 [Solirubrobacteraceae bacterium]|jgi:pyruvate dehydrogenase E2 component (dihydrolipoamide acetyltransferase)
MTETTTQASGSLKGESSVEEPDRSARAIGRRAAEIRATVPDVELGRDVDATAATELARSGEASLTAVLARAAALALRESPWANAAYRDGRFERYGRVNVGVTVQAGETSQLIAAVLDADTKSLTELTEEIDRLSARARDGELTPPEQAGTTFTLSDMSAHPGAQRWSALVIAPQAAALTAGAPFSAPVVRDGAVVPGELISLTLACDHRILFGSRAATLLERIAGRVIDPSA